METIFVSVASYRDKICPTTLKSIYRNSKHPERVFIGVCQQNDVSDVDCIKDGLKGNLSRFKPNVRVIRLRHREAKGPTFARFLCSTLYDNEDYYLQIDSHCKFVRNWDSLLIKMIKDLKKAGVPKPVLSHYTPSFDTYKENVDEKAQVATICKAWFTDQNLISLLGAGWTDPEALPRPNAYIAAGMFFCEGKFLNELPFDPDLDFVFIGEELLLSARFYTNGWDIFTPNRNVIYHMYTRENEPKFWENQHMDAETASKKVRYLLGLDSVDHLTPRQVYLLDLYGLGKERSIDDYFAFAGIDRQNKEVIKDMCSISSHDLFHFTNPPDTASTGSSKKLHPLLILLIVLGCIFVLVGIILALLYRLRRNNFKRV